MTRLLLISVPATLIALTACAPAEEAPGSAYDHELARSQGGEADGSAATPGNNDGSADNGDDWSPDWADDDPPVGDDELGLLEIGVERGIHLRFNDLSTAYSVSNGVALSADGETAAGGISSLVCGVAVQTGGVISSEEYTAVTPVVDSNGEQLLAFNNTTLHISDIHTRQYVQVKADDVITAALDRDGVVSMIHRDDLGCALSEVIASSSQVGSRDISSSLALDSAVCDAATQLLPDPQSDVAFIGVADALLHVSNTGAVSELDCEDCDLMAWDSNAQRLYAAESGDDVLRVFNEDGAMVAWFRVDKPILALDVSGSGYLLMINELSEQHVTLSAFDVAPGLATEVARREGMFNAVERFETATEVDRFALVYSNQVTFLDLE
ncbi:MAG: hypothetical protein H6739_31050 [Alphaproteobacteria bacterium]|nr:hypothetical protein [Alphaproteobacteria bacterium]